MGRFGESQAEREARHARERLVIRLYNLTRSSSPPSLFDVCEMLAEHIDDARVSSLVQQLMRKA